MAVVKTDDGVDISYRVLGTGPCTLLFMHGWAGAGAYFDETLKYLDLTGLRAITFDLRGHGDSDNLTPAIATRDLQEMRLLWQMQLARIRSSLLALV